MGPGRGYWMRHPAPHRGAAPAATAAHMLTKAAIHPERRKCPLVPCRVAAARASPPLPPLTCC